MSSIRLACLCFGILLSVITPASALIVCHDYTYYRVFGKDPSPPASGYNATGGYQHIVERERLPDMECDSPKQRSVDNDPLCPAPTKALYKGRGQSAQFLRDSLQKDFEPLKMPLDVFLSPGVLKPGDVVIISESHSGFVNSGGGIDHFKQLPPRMDRQPFEIYSSEYWSVAQLSGELMGPLCTKVGDRIAYGGVMLNDMPDTFLNRGVQLESSIEIWRRKDGLVTPSVAKPTATVTPMITPSPPDEPTPTPIQSADVYGVFVMLNVAGGSIFVGRESELKSKYTYHYPGGGQPGPGGSGTHVTYELKSPRFANYQDALKHYCQKLETPPRDIPLTGGKKALIFGRDYWVDTAPDCP